VVAEEENPMKGRLSRSTAVALFGASVVLAACQTANHGTALPTMTEQTLEGRPDKAPVAAILSTCGTSIALDAPAVPCKFSEDGYSGTFRIDATSLPKKNAIILPKTGTSDTTFHAFTGVSAGFASFEVLDDKKNKLQITLSHLLADRNHACVHSIASSQKVSLPPTGDVSGTISFDAFPPAAKGCDYVKIATGADSEAAPSMLSPDTMRTDNAGGPKPLLTISIGEGLNSQEFFGDKTVISGMQLQVSPNLNFPDGTYYASIETTSGQRSSLFGVIAFTAKDGVLKIASITAPNGKTIPLVFLAKTSSIITLWPRGVYPPGERSTPTPSPSPKATKSPTPTPSPTRTGAPGAYGNPPPYDGTTFGTYSYVWDVPPCTGAPYQCTETDQPLTQGWNGNADGGALRVPTGISGVVRFDGDIAYMHLYPPVKNDCPSDWNVVAGITGTGSITIPGSDPWMGQDCTITWSTIPPGKTGQYYEETVYLAPL
jgi:hypothetical protein